jgi:hypothetical protein
MLEEKETTPEISIKAKKSDKLQPTILPFEEKYFKQKKTPIKVPKPKKNGKLYDRMV